MTDKQLINRLRRLVKTMYVHMDNGCTDYDRLRTVEKPRRLR